MNEQNFSKELRCFLQCDDTNEPDCQEVGGMKPERPRHILPPDTAFDGCFYYHLVAGKPMIIKTGAQLKDGQKISTKREYRFITYDKTDNCFWTVAKHCPHFIFKLNKCLQEIGHIEPCYPCCTGCDLAGISYDCVSNCLMLCTKEVIMKLAKNETKPCVIVCPDSYERECKSDCAHKCPPPCPPKCRCAKCGGCCETCYCEKCRCERCHGDEKADLIESIALIETALSHILNAEGEKLQKVIASTNDIKLILCTNAEVNKTIIYATHLEHVLYDKLAQVMNCEDFCRDDCGDKCCDKKPCDKCCNPCENNPCDDCGCCCD